MAKAYLLALTNPVAADRESEFDAWYGRVHVPEVVALPGFAGARRFKAALQQLGGASPTHCYAALYELSDAAVALSSLEARGAGLTASSAIELHSVLTLVLDELPLPQ